MAIKFNKCVLVSFRVAPRTCCDQWGTFTSHWKQSLEIVSDTTALGMSAAKTQWNRVFIQSQLCGWQCLTHPLFKVFLQSLLTCASEGPETTWSYCMGKSTIVRNGKEASHNIRYGLSQSGSSCSPERSREQAGKVVSVSVSCAGREQESGPVLPWLQREPSTSHRRVGVFSARVVDTVSEVNN